MMSGEFLASLVVVEQRDVPSRPSLTRLRGQSSLLLSCMRLRPIVKAYPRVLKASKFGSVALGVNLPVNMRRFLSFCNGQGSLTNIAVNFQIDNREKQRICSIFRKLRNPGTRTLGH